MTDIGKKINKRRIELGLSIDELAEKIGKNRATIYRYENGNIEKLPSAIILPLANALKVTPAYLLNWENEETQDFVNNTNIVTVIGRDNTGLKRYEISDKEKKILENLLDTLKELPPNDDNF